MSSDQNYNPQGQQPQYQQYPPPPNYNQPMHQTPFPPPPPIKKSNHGAIIAVVAIVIAILLISVYLILPSTSPLNTVHDADEDGYADSIDAFPNDPDEWDDTDNDGVGDNGDAFPNDSTESEDIDNDGVGDNNDAFPNDPTETIDSDNDGHGDNSDAFPNDSSEWSDLDNDGTGDNADFYDSGNGKIEISITRYQGDNSADTWTSGDPYFIIKVDPDNDGVYESSTTTPVHVDTESLYGTGEDAFTVDIPEDASSIKFQILAYDDDDLTADQQIDYSPESSSYSYIHTVYAPFSDDWSYNGANDLVSGEIDCLLEYSIQAVG